MRPIRRPAPRGVAWNIKGSRGRTRAGRRRVTAELRPLLAGEPLFFGAIESNGSTLAIRNALEGRYGRVAGRGFEGTSTRLYVSKAARIRRSGVMRTRTPWRGPKGGLHLGRAFPWAEVESDGIRLTVAIVHLPWNFERNRRAYSACIAQLVRFAERHDGPLLIVGDWNVGPDAEGTATPAALAERIGGRIIRTGGRIDYAIARDLPTTRGVLGRPAGSDHSPILVDLEAS